MGLTSPPHSGQERLLAALERAYPVRFEQAEPADLGSLDGLLVLGPGPAATNAPARLPRLTLPDAVERRGSDAHASGTHANDASLPAAAENLPLVVLADEPGMARSLRGQAIAETATAEERLSPGPGSTVLASVEDKPVWWRGDATVAVRETAPAITPSGSGSSASYSAYPLASMQEGEALRDHLRIGRFMGLLPLVSFLEEVLGADGWRLPGPRAAFVIDDPNLHRPSYGFLDYAELAAHADAHGYHVALATVPIDGWLADRRAAALLAGNPQALSLVMHGNDHLARELDRLDTDPRAERAMAQALRRIAGLERRAGVSVDRVMTPPHGACSETALQAMFRLGIEAVSAAPPYPWRVGLPTATPLAGWHPAELVAGGLAALPRYALGAPREELALRAMLGQPLILYGHHDDFAQGLDVLAQAATEIGRLGDVRWESLGNIARGSYETWRQGETLLVRMHARRIALDVPAGVRTLRVHVPEPTGGAAGHRLTYAGGELEVAFVDGVGISEPLAVAARPAAPAAEPADDAAGPTRVELTLAADRPLDPTNVPAPGFTPWPWIRRALVEGRDRMQASRPQVRARGGR